MELDKDFKEFIELLNEFDVKYLRNFFLSSNEFLNI